MFSMFNKTSKKQDTNKFTIDTCEDVTRPYSDLFGPMILNCKVIELEYEKKKTGKAPVILNKSVVNEYTLENTNPFVVYKGNTSWGGSCYRP